MRRGLDCSSLVGSVPTNSLLAHHFRESPSHSEDKRDPSVQNSSQCLQRSLVELVLPLFPVPKHPQEMLKIEVGQMALHSLSPGSHCETQTPLKTRSDPDHCQEKDPVLTVAGGARKTLCGFLQACHPGKKGLPLSSLHHCLWHLGSSCFHLGVQVHWMNFPRGAMYKHLFYTHRAPRTDQGICSPKSRISHQ